MVPVSFAKLPNVICQEPCGFLSEFVCTLSGTLEKIKALFPVRKKSGHFRLFQSLARKSGNFEKSGKVTEIYKIQNI